MHQTCTDIDARMALQHERGTDVLYNSETFERLNDPATGLYYQSVGYVYEYLNNELKTGKLA